LHAVSTALATTSAGRAATAAASTVAPTTACRASTITTAAATTTASAIARTNPLAAAVARVMAARRIIVPFVPINFAVATRTRAAMVQHVDDLPAAMAESAVLQATFPRAASRTAAQ